MVKKAGKTSSTVPKCQDFWAKKIVPNIVNDCDENKESDFWTKLAQSVTSIGINGRDSCLARVGTEFRSQNDRSNSVCFAAVNGYTQRCGFPRGSHALFLCNVA